MNNTNKFKESLENNPIFTIISVAVIAITSTWVVAEQIRVNPLQDEMAKQEDEIKEYKSKLKNYKKQSEFKELVIFNSDRHYKEGDKIILLGGQVSVEVSAVIDADSVSFSIDAVDDPDLQLVDTFQGERATFKYDNDQYIIHVKDFIDDEDYDGEAEASASFSISKIKK